MPVSNRSPLAARIAAAPKLHTNDNPLWKGPCADGDLGGITQSMIVRFLSCRERFRLKYVLGLEPHDKWNHYLGYGNMWHLCEEVHASDKPHSWRRKLQDYCMEIAHGRPPNECEDIAKWMNVCNIQFPEYVKYWSTHPDVLNRTPLLQEEVFDVPYTLPSGRKVRLRGKWDSVDLIHDEVTGPGGGIYLQENKTKGDIDKVQVERQLKFDLQTMMYLIALKRRAGAWQGTQWPEEHFQNYPVMGVRYNVVRRPLSGGKGSIKQGEGTKGTKCGRKGCKHQPSPGCDKCHGTGRYDAKPPETSEEFFERLRRDYIAAEPDYWFFRVRSEISAKDVDVFQETCLDPLLETICSWYEYITGNDSAGPAPFGQHYRTPFGVYSALEENGSTEYDAYLETGSEAGLRRVTTLFPELQ